ncbi:Hypothetical protein ORPV_651 [Orpheovirus IHUMI-LCC2]|uniref:Uncharacterized protein n=1 Tax=Orpheovirus IHUMI-LCC2 TaxID=2023057 RepID=A0A2I2L4S0_9VIRU|nr:Hypothetical protein ORPV_651 [Orpheovirus IHUMI-LCC2]SNW62555.1 Hypothetical protein ORPV_651 [Orpheovirus IHUMI-LCC2]
MEDIDCILHIVSLIKNIKTIYYISFINKKVYDDVRKPYYKRKIIENFIPYDNIIEYYLSLSFVEMLKLLKKTKIRGLFVGYVGYCCDWTSFGDIIVFDDIKHLVDNLHSIMPKVNNNYYHERDYYCDNDDGHDDDNILSPVFSISMLDSDLTVQPIMDYYFGHGSVEYGDRIISKRYKLNVNKLCIKWKRFKLKFKIKEEEEEEIHNLSYEFGCLDPFKLLCSEPYVDPEEQRVTYNGITYRYDHDSNNNNNNIDHIKMNTIKDVVSKYLLADIKL